MTCLTFPAANHSYSKKRCPGLHTLRLSPHNARMARVLQRRFEIISVQLSKDKITCRVAHRLPPEEQGRFADYANWIGEKLDRILRDLKTM